MNYRPTTHRRLLSVVGALSMMLAASPAGAQVLSGSASSAATASDSPRNISLPGSLPPRVRHAQRLQAVDGSRQISINVTLRVTDSAALDQFLSDLYDPSSSSYHHFLTTRQFAQRFGPDGATRATVTSWLQGQGLRVLGTTGNGLQITAEGSASQLTSAFRTPLYSFQQGSHTFMANTQPIQVPGTLASSVLAVSGLSTSVEQQPVPISHAVAHARFDGYSPSDTHQLYNLSPLYSRGISGSGQTVGIATFGDFAQANVSTFDQEFSLAASAPSRVAVTAGRSSGAPLGVSNGQDETEMDVEMIQATAPGASILVYEAPNSDQGAVALYNRIVSDNRAKVITTSWGGPETLYPSSELSAIHQAVQEGAAQGQAFFAASGDDGAYDEASFPKGSTTKLAVDYPAADPWVTGVGGTSLQANGTQYVGEVVWSDTSDPSHPGASGGGLSATFARPSWQTGPGVSNQYSNGKRQVPDVSADADPATGYSVYTIASRGSSWGVVGGTSAASPLWAGFAALVNQASGRTIGSLNPTLYELGQQASSLPRAPFHDVTQGTNLYYPATAGWDFATGWGSFDGDAFVADLSTLPAPQPIATASPTRTPAPTATPAPTITVKQAILLHKVSGKLKPTSALKVGEAGTLVILYSSKNAGSLASQGTVQLKQGGKVIKTLTLKRTTFQGHPALTATVRFTSPTRVGSLLARITLRLGSGTGAFSYTFSVIKP